MADLIYLGITFAFFGLAAVFVRACARIVGPDERAVPVDRGGLDEPVGVAA